MRVITIPAEEAQRWEDFVESCPRTIAWHSYHWSHAVSSNYEVDFHPLAAEENGVIRGILPLYQLRGPKAPTRLISVPFAVAGGMATEDDTAGRALMDAAVELSQRLGAGGITLKQYRYPAPGTLKTDENYFNRELSLGVGIDRIWNQLHEQNRKAIESAEKADLVLEIGSNRVADFYDMLLGFMTRSGVPCPSRRWIQTLLDLKMYSIATLSMNGKLVSATMFKTFRKTVSFPFTCMRNRSSLDATYALYWRLIQHFATHGYQIFHSGRMPQSEDVEAYRLGWGGQKHTYYYQYYPEAQGRTETQHKRGLKRELFTACWKLMPKPLAGAIGPRIAARFP